MREKIRILLVLALFMAVIPIAAQQSDVTEIKTVEFDIKSNYNFEVLSFFNVLTSDDYYVQQNKKAYDKFYPLLSAESRNNIAAMVEILHRTNIAFPLNLLLAQISDYENNSVTQSFAKKAEINAIVAQVRHTNYVPLSYLDHIDTVLVMSGEIINDLEANGFKEYWQKEVKPSVDSICAENQKLVRENEFINIFLNYKPSLPDKINIFVSRFQRPHGTKLSLTGDAMILSDNFGNRTLMVIAHEMFHPPYDYQKVQETLKKLSVLPFVIDAFNNQKDNVRYSQMDYFLEENIVETLGYYVAYKLGIEKDPEKYFKEHDYGSHVLSSLFFDYMLKHPKDKDEPFEKYLYDFTSTLTGNY